MATHLSSYFVNIHYRLTWMKENPTTDALGFPYCVLMYTVAFVTIVGTLVVEFMETRRQQQEFNGHPQAIKYEAVEMSSC